LNQLFLICCIEWAMGQLAKIFSVSEDPEMEEGLNSKLVVVR
jgi:hypothetical protein